MTRNLRHPAVRPPHCATCACSPGDVAFFLQARTKVSTLVTVSTEGVANVELPQPIVITDTGLYTFVTRDNQYVTHYRAGGSAQ